MVATKKTSRKSSGRSKGNLAGKHTQLGRTLIEGAKLTLKHLRGEIALSTRYVHVVPNVDVKAIRETQGFSQQEFASRYGLSLRSLQEWEQRRRQPESAVRAYMLVIRNQPAAVQKALKASAA